MQALIIICEQTRTYAREKRSVTRPHDHSDSLRIGFSLNNHISKCWRFYSAHSKEPMKYARKKLGLSNLICSTAN